MCRSLYFEDKPEYSYLRRLLRALFKRHHFTHDIVFDWNLLKISGTEGAGGGGANGTGGGSGGVNANGEKQNNNSNNNNNSNPNAGALVPTAGGSGGGQKVIAPAALALAVYQDQRQQQADVDCSDVQQKGKSRHHFPNAVSYGYVPPNQTAGLKSQPQPPASLEDAIERADRFVEVEKSRAANAQNWRPTPHRPQTPNTSNFTSHRFGHNFNNGNRYRPPHPHYQPRYNQPKDDQRPQCQCGVRPWQPEDRRSPQKPEPARRQTLSYTSNLSGDLHQFFLCRASLSVVDSCLMVAGCVVISYLLRHPVLRQFHAAHPSTCRVKSTDSSFAYGSGIDSHIDDLIRRCSRCQQAAKMPPRQPSIPWQPSWRAWSRSAGSLNAVSYLILADAYSKWPYISPQNLETAPATIAFLRRIFSQHGLLEVLV
ncbi:hypothetical protein SprV_0501874900 [Sparganum proliferum]